MKKVMISTAAEAATARPMMAAGDKPWRSSWFSPSLSSTSSKGASGTSVMVVLTVQMVSETSVVLSTAGKSTVPFMIAANRSRTAASSPKFSSSRVVVDCWPPHNDEFE